MRNKNKQTKFPVARIKKIMQKDEEVGKVAQATPIVISKALERFLALIVAEASNVALARGSKRVEAYHLKHAVETTEMLDFLKEIVEGVPDPSAGGKIDLDGENGEGTKKKRGKGKKSAPAAGGTEPAGRKKRKKKGETQTESVAATSAAAADAEVEGEGEGKSDGDVAMEEVDDHEEDRGPGYGSTSHKKSRRDSAEGSEWRGEDEDVPYIPRT